MKPQRIIMFIGFAFAFVVIVIALLVAVLYIKPDWSFLGVSTVSQRSSYTKYFGDDVEAMLAHRNLIIESKTIDIEIRVRKVYQEDEDSIIVFEDASGISFNSLKRTQIDFTQVLDDDGEVYYKLTILEPAGVLSRRGYVVINLFRNDIDDGSGHFRQPYNIILNTRKSNVVFSGDTEAEYLLVNNITLANATGQITFPTPTTSAPFEVEFTGNLIVNSSARVTCKSDLNNVEINSNYGIYNFGNIDGNVTINGSATLTAADIGGKVIVENSRLTNSFSAANISGDVDFLGDYGTLKIKSCNNLYVRTKYASVSVSGSCNDFDFESGNTGNATIGQIKGKTDVVAVYGAITLKKVYGCVDIENKYGLISVEFAVDTSQVPYIKVKGYDGQISIKNIVGPIDIDIKAGGKSTIYTEFRKVIGGENSIVHRGSTRPNSTDGNITVYLVGAVEGFNLTVDASRGAYDYINNKEFPNRDTQFINGGAGADDIHLNIKTSAKFELRAKSY